MRIDSRVNARDPMIARARVLGAVFTGMLLVTGCGMITVVEESQPSDYALCVEKREAGNVTPELAALDCLQLAGEPAAQNG